ncbi:uncharacterized protein AC631_05538 [Debaryomyces fabryi]|uniref:peptidylprolyl isomerase n=1 Tax=Debaryomyces fabryi TaxID=58627 RepID=A0A0V1PR32_9ASCO|nr:uncharacterized protein AC631_05538 [Debaryomyces fabryi]KRZ98696.1 hypothetical protein AC631_05538 [Debaryomyces fabryi]CUM56490.1 unnamed protein product [Debaryomyces fabryi]
MKRNVEDESSSSSDSSDDDLVGPSLDDTPSDFEKQKPLKKRKKKTIIDETKLIENIQFNEEYGYSYLQESNVSCVTLNPIDDSILIAGLKNGSVKFWRKKTSTGNEKSKDKDKDNKEGDTGQLEFIKQFSAHPQKEVSQLIIDSDGTRLASIAKNDSNVKIFDLVTLDMIQVVNLNFIPNTKSNYVSCWYKSGNINHLVINEQDTNRIHILNPDDDDTEIIKTIHRNRLNVISYNPKYQCIISSDMKGIIEYWTPQEENTPKSVQFKYKSETDLLEFAKSKSPPTCISFSPDFETFATISYPDNCIRLFDFKSGKLLKSYDESIKIYEKDEANIQLKLINAERKIFIDSPEDILEQRNIIFDESGKFLLFGTLQGIKILSLQTNKVIKILGTDDQLQLNLRFHQLLLSNKSSISNFSTEMLSSNNSILNSSLNKVPILISSAVNSDKIFLFNNLQTPRHNDIDFTIKPRVKKQTPIKENKSSKIILHTTSGDIKLKLFNDLAPKTTENFIKLCEKGYYNSTIFHRVIKDFMIQAGDPLGNGTGGESYWGGYLKDEFNSTLRHSKPFMVSMANSGPDTNGSQFFITTEKAPWLDNKHTIFAEVIDGFEAVKSIENTETDADDKPLDQVVLLSTSTE